MAISLVFVLATFLIFISTTASAGTVDFNYPAVFNFGDSNSDTGGLVSGLGEILDPPYGQTYFLRPAGRFCDGRLTIDFLMNAMGLPFLNAYLEAVGTPSFLKGCNFAVAGSTILPATASSVSPFSFGIQVAQFLHFKLRAAELLAKGNNYKKYVPPSSFFSDGLYMFDIGQNDLAGAFYTRSQDQVFALIPTILLEFETGLKRLYDHGIRKFWVHNTGPLGCLAQNVAQFGKDPSKLDEFGCVSSHNRAAKLFNLQLHALCTKLHDQFGGANVVYVDVFTIKFDLIANHSRYGFEHPITVCCGYGGELNYDSRIRCGQTKIIDGSLATAKDCNDTNNYVSWDGIHLTEVANQYVSSQILTGKYTDPPFSDKMPFFLKLIPYISS